MLTMYRQGGRFRSVFLAAAGVLLTLPIGCSDFALSALTAPLGTGAPGSRGNVSMTIFNRTPYRAIFTVAFYNTFDQNTQPVFFQFADGTQGTVALEGNSVIGPQDFQCDRVLGIGSPQLLQAIRKMDPPVLHEAAMIEGVGFSAAPVDDPLGLLPTEGTAEGVNIFQGAEFPCEAQLWLFLEVDDTASGGFRIAFEVVTPP